MLKAGATSRNVCNPIHSAVMLQQHNYLTHALSRGAIAWGASPARMGMATPPPPPAYAPRPLRKGEEAQRTSRTVAATPARNDAGSPPPAPDYNSATSQPPQNQQHQQNQRPQQQQQQQRNSDLFISDGESSIRSVQQERDVMAPSSPEGAPRVNWRSFDKPPPSGGRNLATRKCTFKIFVIFRGGWCTSSHALLKGERAAAQQR